MKNELVGFWIAGVVYVLATFGANIQWSDAQTLTVPLPPNCAAALSQQSGGNFALSCSSQPPPPPPPPPPGPISCPGFSNTQVIPMALGNSALLVQTSGFSATTAIVVKLTIPAGASGGHFWNAVEFGTPPTPRNAALSTQPCDFVGIASVVDTQAPSFSFLIAPSTRKDKPILTPGVTYYINMDNQFCQIDACDMRLTLS